MIDTARLHAIRQREQQATKGPWEAKPTDDGRCDGISPDYHDHDPALSCWDAESYTCPASREIVTTDSGYYGPKWSDAEFIAHAREDIPYLLSVIDTLQQQQEYLTAEKQQLLKALEEENVEDALDAIRFNADQTIVVAQEIKTLESWPSNAWPSMHDRRIYAALLDRAKQAEASLARVSTLVDQWRAHSDAKPNSAYALCAETFADDLTAALQGKA